MQDKVSVRVHNGRYLGKVMSLLVPFVSKAKVVLSSIQATEVDFKIQGEIKIQLGIRAGKDGNPKERSLKPNVFSNIVLSFSCTDHQ